MARLRDLAKVIRSKNAGPFYLTMDVMFADDATYQHVRDSNVITKESAARLYRRPTEQVQVITHDTSRSIKITIVRPVAAGDPADTDIYGAQQHVPLLDLEVPSP